MVEIAGEQVFVPGEGCSEEVMASAGMCIASADLLFSESTVEQVGHFLCRLFCCLDRDAKNWHVTSHVTVPRSQMDCDFHACFVLSGTFL